MAKNYQHTQKLLPQIKEMLAKGMTQKQVEDALGLSGYRPVHGLLKREQKKDKGYQSHEGASQQKHCRRIGLSTTSQWNSSRRFPAGTRKDSRNWQ